MSNDTVITLEDAGKRYTKYEDVPLLVTRALRSSTRRSHLWALRHIDLEVSPGEAVGVIGRNGAGKTTMLRMLAGITAPTEGRVQVRGRVAPLIAVGVGFHTELTGRENVYVNGTVLGLSRQEIDRRFDSIVEFAELSDFIDTPVKFYSSGMFVRLGFAVAVAARPDVLLVDEVLAVGDVQFQLKCFDRMQEMRDEGTTMVLVSHNLNAVRLMCDRVMVIKQGEPVFQGEPEEAITAYYDQNDGLAEEEGVEAPGDAPIRFLSWEMLDPEGRPTAHADSGDEVQFRLRVRFVKDVIDPTFGFILHTGSGVPVYTDSTFLRETGRFTEGQETICDVKVPARLTTGAFSARAVVRWTPDRDDQVTGPPVNFHVTGPELARGVVNLGAVFEIDGRAR